jgi:hypothetical protein
MTFSETAIIASFSPWAQALLPSLDIFVVFGHPRSVSIKPAGESGRKGRRSAVSAGEKVPLQMN